MCLCRVINLKCKCYIGEDWKCYEKEILINTWKDGEDVLESKRVMKHDETCFMC